MAERQQLADGEHARVEAPLAKMSAGDAKALVERAREAIAESWQHDRENREEAATDLAFLGGRQWPDQVRREREEAARPMLTINRLPQFVRQVTNDIRQADLAIKVAPEDDTSDPQLAKIYNGLIRQIQYRSSAQHVFATAAEHQAGCGIGWFRVTTRYVDDMAFDQEIVLRAIPNPLSVYCDPGAVDPDRADGMWMAVTEMLPRKAFSRRYPKAAEVAVDANRDSAMPQFWWASDDGVRIAEWWWKEPATKLLGLLADGETMDLTGVAPSMHRMLGVVRTRECHTWSIRMAVVSGAEVLEGPFEWQGQYIPLVPVIGGEFPVEHRRYRYSVIRFARDAQQLYNFYRTATAEAIALAPKAPYIATAKQIGPYKALWDTMHTKNRPYLLYAPDAEAPGVKPQREHPPELPSALMQEAQVAADDMKSTTGIYDAALGQRSNETAGIAIKSRQSESDVANYHFVDNLQRSLEHAGRILVDLIPKVYDNERVIRLMHEDGREEPVRINQVVMAVDGTPIIRNDLSQASFDIRVTIGRGYATKRMETADALMQFMKSIPNSAPLLGDLVAKALDFPDAEVIARRLKNTIPPAILADPDDPNNPPPPPPDPLADPKVRVEVELKHAQARQAIAMARKIELEAAAGLGIPITTMPGEPVLAPEPPMPTAEMIIEPAAPPPMPPMPGAPPMGPPQEIDEAAMAGLVAPPQGESPPV